MSADNELQQANSHMAEDNFQEALQHYNAAIQLQPNIAESYIKRSICNYKLENYTDAVADAKKAVELEPNNSKGYLRKGMACFALEEYEAAKSAFEKGQQLDSSNSNFKTWIRKCNAELDIDENATATPANSQPLVEQAAIPPTNSNSTTQATIDQNPKLRHEWYQTATHVIVTIFVKGATKENTIIELQERNMSVSIKLSASADCNLDIDLADKIVPAESTTVFMSTKIEIKLKKGTGNRWKTLEDHGEVPLPTAAPTSSNPPQVKQPKNWDKVVSEISKVEPLDTDGDPLNKVFQDIYSNGTEEQRRAMMKSFLESGGTVLSTNWDEVGKDKVKGSPPEGLEMRKWEELNKGK